MPYKAKIVTRSSTVSTVTQDNLNKGEPLTFEDIDGSLLNLRDQSIGIASDDSTVITVGMGNTIKIAGAGTVTTAVSGDTLTITGTGGGGSAQGITVVGDDSTGTLIADGETVKIAGAQNITTAVSGDTLTITGPNLSSYATQSYVTSQGYITNSPLTIVGDDSTGTILNTGETIKIAGASNITTAVSGDILTITGPDLSSYATTTYVDNKVSANNTLTIADDTSTTSSIDLDNTLQVIGGNNITTSISGSTLTITGDKSIDVNEINSGDSSAIQINDNVNVSGTFNAKTIVTNDLISEDSSAINILDGLNVSGATTINNTLAVTGATTINNTLAVTGDITTADSLQFDTAAGEATATGKLYYSSDYGTLAHGLGDGTEIIDGIDLVAYVTNAEATTLVKGEVVYIFGASGDRPSVKRADNSGDPTSSKTLGIVKNNITAGSAGYVITQGIITGLNLDSYTAGDVLWLSTGGAFTATKPLHPAHLVFVGVVLRANAGNGLVYVKPQNGYELDELHDVDVSTAVANDILKYNGSAWVNTPGGELIYNGNSITAASNADIDLTAGGTGNINLNADTIRLGDSGSDATLTTNGTGDLILNTNSGTSSGVIKIADGSAGKISIIPNTTGRVDLGHEAETTTNFPTAVGSLGAYEVTDARIRGTGRFYSNLTYAPYTATTDQLIAGNSYAMVKTNGGSFDSANIRNVASANQMVFDLNGGSATATTTNVTSTGVGSQVNTNYYMNTAGGTKTGLNSVNNRNFTQIVAGHGGALTIPRTVGVLNDLNFGRNTGDTTTLTEVWAFRDQGITYSGTGTTGTNSIVTDYTAFETGVNTPSSTNTPWAFRVRTAGQNWRSRIGAVDLPQRWSSTTTHSSGGAYTVDFASTGNGFRQVTLSSNITSFTMSGFPTSTTVISEFDIVFIQDGTGGRTISFTPTSTEVFKFRNGTSTLSDSTAAPEVLHAKVFVRYDGTKSIFYWDIDNREYV